MSDIDISKKRMMMCLKKIIESQLRILELNGKRDPEITISVPILTTQSSSFLELVKEVLEEIFGFQPDILWAQTIEMEPYSIMIVCFSEIIIH